METSSMMTVVAVSDPDDFETFEKLRFILNRPIEQVLAPRDAILAADDLLTGDGSFFSGANQCSVWSAFARRGLGASADQGSVNSVADGTEALEAFAKVEALTAGEGSVVVTGTNIVARELRELFGREAPRHVIQGHDRLLEVAAPPEDAPHAAQNGR